MSLTLVLHDSPAGGVTVRASLERAGARVERSAPLGPIEAADSSLGPALFRPPIAELLTLALADDPCPIALQVEVAGLGIRRWDRLTAPIDGGWRLLATHPQVQLRRTVPAASYLPPRPRSRGRQRALVVVAGPAGLEDYSLDPFDVAAALHSVVGALDELPHSILADGGPAIPTHAALFDRLAAEEPTILHIIAHGRYLSRDQDAALYLSGPEGGAAPLRGRVLVERLAALRARPSLIFLTACESAVAGADAALGNLAERLIRDAGVPQVIAMADKVSVATALSLHRSFYPRLLHHGDAGRALAEALAAQSDRPDRTVPGLWSRPGAGPLFGLPTAGSLTDEERRDGIERLASLLPVRAPTAQAELAALRAAPADPAVQAQIEALCEEVLELPFAALATGAPVAPQEPTCPFLGLHAFDEADARFFFGRDPLIEALLARLAQHPFLAVLGPSGSGKSSVVRAGLVPRRKAADPTLQVFTMTPGEAPDRALRRRPPTAGLVVVDQLEEAFTLAPPDAARAFFAELLALPPAVPVIVTMRADFWGKVATETALAAEMSAHQTLVGPLPTADLAGVMGAQAAAVGLRFDSGLPQRIVEQLQAEPGAMPLLQHALRELWARRRGRWLRNAAYDALGGVSASIARSAEALFEAASPAEQAHLRRIFLRLTRLGDATQGEEDTRRRARREDLLPRDDAHDTVAALLNRTVELRLLVAAPGEGGAETLEVAHEALIRRWPRLRQWINEDREALALAEELRRSALDWARQGEHPAYLEHRGRRAEALAPSLAAGLLHPDPTEQRYLDACAAADAAQAAAAEAAHAAQLAAAEAEADRARQNTRRATILLALSIVTVFAVAFLAYDARTSSRRAADEARVARASLVDPGNPLRATLLREVQDPEQTAGWMGQTLDTLLRPRAAITRGTLRGVARAIALADETFDLYVATDDAVERWTVEASAAKEIWPIPAALQVPGPTALRIDESNGRWLLSHGGALWSPWLGIVDAFDGAPLDLDLADDVLFAVLPEDGGFTLSRFDPWGFAAPTPLLKRPAATFLAMRLTPAGPSLVWREAAGVALWQPPMGPPLLLPADVPDTAIISPEGDCVAFDGEPVAPVYCLRDGLPHLEHTYSLDRDAQILEVTADHLITMVSFEAIAVEQRTDGSRRQWSRGAMLDAGTAQIDDDSGEIAAITFEGGVAAWPSPRTIEPPRQPLPMRLEAPVYVDATGFLMVWSHLLSPMAWRWSPGDALDAVHLPEEEDDWILPTDPSPEMLVRHGAAASLWRPFADALSSPPGLQAAAAWAGPTGALHPIPNLPAVLAVRDEEARLYHLDTGVLRETLHEPLHDATITFAPDGQSLVALSPDRPPLLYWFGQGGRSIHLGDHDGPAIFSPSGARLALTGAAGVTVFDARTGAPLPQDLPHDQSCVPADFSDDDEALLLICGHTDLWEWDLTRDRPPTQVTTPIRLLRAHYSPGGAAVLAEGAASLILWPPGEDKPAIPLSAALVRAAAFVGDGQTLRVVTPTADVIDLPLSPAALQDRLWRYYPACVPESERARTLNEAREVARRAHGACLAALAARGLP